MQTIRNIWDRVIWTSNERIYPNKEVQVSDEEAKFLLDKQQGHLESADAVQSPSKTDIQEEVEQTPLSSTNQKSKKRKRVWVHDDAGFNKLVFADEIPKGFHKGRIKK